MKQFLLSLSALLVSYGLSAQTISGIVIDAETLESIGYVSIGIEGTAKGTVADATGRYTLNLRPEHGTDTVCFSHIGYESVRLPISNLASMKRADIVLYPAITKLKEVVVTAKRYRRRTFGNSFQASDFSTSVGQTPGTGAEDGTLFKFKKPVRLENINISVLNCLCDSVKFRINIYKQTTDGSDFVNIQTQPIYACIYRTDSSENGTTITSIDISKHNIVAEGNTLVAFELIDAYNQTESKFGWLVTFPIGLIGGNNTYVRSSSQDTWSEEGMKLPISVTGLVER